MTLSSLRYFRNAI